MSPDINGKTAEILNATNGVQFAQMFEVPDN